MHMLWTLITLILALPPSTLGNEPGLRSVPASTRAMWLIDGSVVDAETGKAVEQFIVTPGTIGSDEDGRTKIRWRENLQRKMKDGELRWPRTSGFSVMRFRVSAKGYHPVTTHRIWRGGPYTRMRVALKPKANQTATSDSNNQ